MNGWMENQLNVHVAAANGIKNYTYHNWCDCSWGGYPPGLVVVGMKALKSLPTSTSIVLNRNRIIVNMMTEGWDTSGSMQPTCVSNTNQWHVKSLTCPKVCQSSRSLKRSVLFRWMIRWRLVWLQNSNMNCVCREHVSERIRMTMDTLWASKPILQTVKLTVMYMCIQHLKHLREDECSHSTMYRCTYCSKTPPTSMPTSNSHLPAVGLNPQHS